MDSPAAFYPTDELERKVLAELQTAFTKLELLKNDRAQYIRTQDVMPIYQQVMDQLELLSNKQDLSERREDNQVDRVLESCLQLISLLFMTVGRNNDPPAVYALTSTIRRLLDHLTESSMYCAKDLESLADEIGKLMNIINSPDEHSRKFFIDYMSRHLEQCQSLLKELQDNLATVAEPLLPVHEKIISIMRSISLFNTRSSFSTGEIQNLQLQAIEISDTRVNGQFLDEHGEPLPGSALVSDRVDRCLRWATMVLERKGQFPEQFKSLYDTLYGVRNELEKVSLTKAWSLRETDLYDFQRKLDWVDAKRVNGNWLDEEGHPAELFVQRTLLYLLRRSYAYIYSLMLSSEPVSEALLPVYNQLQTLKRCLVEVKDNGGVSSERELYPYSMKLHSLDDKRVDGKFMVGSYIPEGQAAVMELLSECFELNYELRVEASERAEAAEARRKKGSSDESSGNRGRSSRDDDDSEDEPLHFSKG